MCNSFDPLQDSATGHFSLSGIEIMNRVRDSSHRIHRQLSLPNEIRPISFTRIRRQQIMDLDRADHLTRKHRRRLLLQLQQQSTGDLTKDPMRLFAWRLQRDVAQRVVDWD
jgi:hypothetical protein